MKLYDEFKDSLVGELNTEEIRELAKFAAAFSTVKRKRDAEGVQTLIKQAAAEITDVDDFYYVENLVSFLEKNASKKGFDWGKAGRIATIGLTTAAAVAPLAQQLYRGHQAKKKYVASLRGIQMDHPDLFSPTKVEQTQRNFGVLKDFAPQIAQNSLVAGNVLKRMEEYGPRAMDINVVKEMANTQKYVSDFSGRGSTDAVNSLATGARELSQVLPQETNAMKELRGKGEFLAQQNQNLNMQAQQLRLDNKDVMQKNRSLSDAYQKLDADYKALTNQS